MTNILDAAKAGQEIEVYLYQDTLYGTIQIYANKNFDNDYIQIAKGKVVFTMNPDETIIEEAVESFKAQRQEVYAAAETKISSIKEVEAKFLSLTHQPESIDGY